jgi:hypothetical protein
MVSAALKAAVTAMNITIVVGLRNNLGNLLQRIMLRRVVISPPQTTDKWPVKGECSQQ